MRQFKLLGAALGVALLVAACGGGGGGDTFGTQVTHPARGQLMQIPPALITSLTPASFTASLNASATGQGLLQVAGAPVCGVDVQYIKYGTVGGAGEQTDASGALMVPTGTAAQCSGARPIVLYAHGTNITQRYNLAEIADSSNPANSESVLLAAMYAAQGYIVVAPNYAGYDSSSLTYHPYVNADQQSKDMLDALAAAKSALPAGKAGTKLFLTGYSQGGFVAMATQRALQLAGTPVTASAPMSGPYALAAYLDAIFYGNVALGSTAFAPLATNSFQKAYGNIYTTPADMYETTYATGIESLVPGVYDFTTVYSSGKLPQTTLFSSTPPADAFAGITPPTGTGATDALFALGFGTSNLIKNSARLDYLMDAMANPDGAVPTTSTAMPATAPVNKIRVAAKANDLRGGWSGPETPTLLCGGNADPTVFYSVNTQLMGALWGTNGLVTVLDVDSSPTGATDPFAAAKVGFTTTKTNTYTAAYNAATAAGKTAPEATADATSAVTVSYHGSLVPPFCNAAARGFFSQF